MTSVINGDREIPHNTPNRVLRSLEPIVSSKKLATALILIWIFSMMFAPRAGVGRFWYWGLSYTLPIMLWLWMGLLVWFQTGTGLIRKRFKTIELVVPGYLLLAFLSILLSGRLLPSKQIHLIEFYSRAILPLSLYLYIRLMDLRVEDFKKYRVFVIVSFLLLSLIALLSFFSPEVLPNIWPGRALVRGDRATGPFPAPYSLGIVTFFLLLFIFLFLDGRQGLMKSLMKAALVSVGGITIFLTLTRSVWLGIVLASAVLAWFLIRKRILFTALLLSLTALFGIWFLFSTQIIESPSYQRVMERLENVENVNARLVLNQAGLRMTLEKPLWGWGYGSYDQHDWMFVIEDDQNELTRFTLARGTSHNTWLTISAETGLLGLGLYLISGIFWLVQSIKIWPDQSKDGQYQLTILWSFVLSVIVVSLFTDLRFKLIILGLMWIMIAIAGNTIVNFQAQWRLLQSSNPYDKNFS